ncbi:MAG: HNH endonuclease [Caldilineaceae bacterium]|nr:HNH endonuclease [Caldilineaceae bacterium]
MMVGPYIPNAVRLAVIERAEHLCEYCLSPADWSPEIFEIEHVRPLGAGGTTELSNLAYACPACNRYKQHKLSATDPVTDQTTHLFNPRTERWSEHFRWSEDLTTIVGVTIIGRATVVTLRMNRQSVQRFRQALVAIRQHPAL